MSKLDVIRGLVRPILTLSGFGVISALAWQGRLDVKEYLLVVSPLIAFWFGSRVDSNGGK